MNILALETATEFCSVALATDGHKITKYTESGKGIHSEALFTGIEFVLDKNNLVPDSIDMVLLSEGPGSYTGLRIGYSVAKGFLFGTMTKLYTVNTLLSIATGVTISCSGFNDIHIVLDARRKHFIHQSFSFRKDLLIPLKKVEIISIDMLPEIVKKKDILAGTGLHRIDYSRLPDVLIIPDFPVEAEYLIHVWKMQLEHPDSHLAIETDPGSTEPVYLTPGI